jgi:flagellar basal body rod protein FlgC
MGSSTMGIARSGLEVAGLTLDVSAHNVANALTEGFEPERVVPSEAEGGGVTGAVEKAVDSKADPMAEVRADRALLVPGNVDLARELVTQSRAAAAYRANLAVLRTQESLEAETVEALKPG